MKTSSRKSISAALLALLMLVAMPVSTAFAGTDLRSAGAGADVADVGTIAWNNPGNITIQDNLGATAILTPLAASHYLTATNFGFSVPVDAPIVGIRVTLWRRASSTVSVVDNAVRLIKGSVVSGDNKADLVTKWPAPVDDSFVSASYGSASDLWSVVWSPADINDANFGVALAVQNNNSSLNRTAHVDLVQISVTYGVASTTGVSCTGPAEYGTGTTCTVTVTRSVGLDTPGGSVAWSTDGSGTFSSGGVCSLSGSGASGTCSVTYTPSAVGDGSHLITATYPGDSNFLGSSGNQALTVNPRPITVTADAKSKTYGDDDPALTQQITLGSLLSGDAITGSMTRVAGENVGAYAIGQGGLTAGPNYDLTYVGANLTINTRPVEVTADAKSKTYGAVDPGLTYQITNGSLAFSDAFTGALTRVAGENVGSYAIQKNTLSLGTNYDLTYVGANLTINERPITVTAVTDTREYDGTTDSAGVPTLTSGTLAFTDTATWTQGFDTKNVGTGKTLTPTGSVSDGNGGANYNVTFAPVTTGEVTARPITVTADDKSKAEFEADPPLTASVTSGSLIAPDALSGALARVAGETPGTYAINQGTLDAGGNYNMTFVPGTFTITELNVAPTDISLSPSSVKENRPAGTTVGTLSTTDPDIGDTFTYTICGGDSASFSITGSSLKTAVKFNFEARSSYSVCIQTDDGHGGTFQETLPITVLDLPETFPSAATADGWVLEASETSGTGGTLNSTAAWFNLGDNAQNQQFRSLLSFNTAGLPDNAVITRVTLKIRLLGTVGTNPFTTHQKLFIDLRTGPFGGAGALQLADFNAIATLNSAGMVSSTQLAGGWYRGSLTATALSKVNKKGLTQLRLRFQLDDNNDLGADYLKFYSGNAAAASRPVLIIEYTVP